ncbi:hypothetical protein GGI15_001099 [Coemansia interrupta]|uniref:SPX domain-containing protein n=1 Tax=Coemansia interrupta TaxID=1126814 RepID=A0A9W8LP67_9FUNG|nr:hypothetical protein GGI15_001099 [Coemansia interrupta]
MKFGKTIETSAKELPEDWQPYIIQYKLLKKSIKQIVRELDSTFKTLNLPSPAVLDPEVISLDETLSDIGNTDDMPSSLADSTSDYGSKPKSGLDSMSVLESSLPDKVVSVPEEIAYNIEKDSDGVVHPVITVRIRKPVASAQCDQILELPDVAGLPERTAIILPSGHSSTVSSSSRAPEAVNPAGVSSDIQIRTEVMDDAEETQVTVRLQTDQMFFDQLVRYIERTHAFEQTYTKQYNSNVSALGDELTTVTSPYKHDFEVWREIFRLYIDADVWEHSEGDFRPTNSAKEGQDRFSKFMRHIENIGLTTKFRDPLSGKLLVGFYKLNSELTYLKMLQEMNELAMRKILKKHDKRTQLVSKTQFPRIITIDTSTLTKALIFTIHTELVGIVPQIDDYLCPMCLNIAWRPLRLDCAHVFCSRCVVKASKRCMFDCPVCRAKNAIYNAGVSNIDKALLNFLKLYFPKEVKEKQRDIQQEISHEETSAIVAAHARERPCTIM